MLPAVVLTQHWVLASRTIGLYTPCHVQCTLWATLLGRGLQFVQCRRTRLKSAKVLHCVWTMKSPNTSLQAIDLKPSCSGQAQFNRLGIGHGYESTEPECILTVFRVPSVIHQLSDTGLARSI